MNWRVCIYLPAPAKEVAILLKFLGQRWPACVVEMRSEVLVVTIPTREESP